MADTFYELKKLAEKTSLQDSIIKLEAELTGLTPKHLRLKVEYFIETMHSAIKNGLNSTEPSKSTLVGFNAALLNKPNEYEFVSPLC